MWPFLSSIHVCSDGVAVAPYTIMISNEQIIQTIKDAVEPLEFVFGLFEGGAIAFGREDEYSDIDLHFIVDDDRSIEVLPIVEKALLGLAPIKDKFELPEPTWFGGHQTFFRLEGTPEWLMIDCAVMKNSAEDKFLQPEEHGNHIIHFDKTGIHDSLPSYDLANTHALIRDQLPGMAAQMTMFAHLPSKFVKRGKNIDALHFYRGLILTPLTKLLRMKYDPTRFGWSPRYLYDYLPEADVQKYERLNFVADAADLSSKIDEALAWFLELHSELKDRYER